MYHLELDWSIILVHRVVGKELILNLEKKLVFIDRNFFLQTQHHITLNFLHLCVKIVEPLSLTSLGEEFRPCNFGMHGEREGEGGEIWVGLTRFLIEPGSLHHTELNWLTVEPIIDLSWLV